MYIRTNGHLSEIKTFSKKLTEDDDELIHENCVISHELKLFHNSDKGMKVTYFTMIINVYQKITRKSSFRWQIGEIFNFDKWYKSWKNTITRRPSGCSRLKNQQILAFWKYSYSMKQRGQNGRATGNIRSEIEKFFGKWKEDHFGFWWYFIHNWPCTVEI